jgi:YkoY family integral membrane protein
MESLFVLPLAQIDIFGQRFVAGDIVIVLLLVLLEGVLSIDNALVLGLLAKRLPKHQQKRALTYGLIGAFVFRFLAIGTATFLLQWTFVKFLGGAYLVYIAVRHLFFESQEEEKEKIVLDEHGHPVLVEEETGEALSAEEEEQEIRERVPVYMKPETRKRVGAASFWPTVFVIEMTDIAFAVDSILAAIALVGAPPKDLPAGSAHPKLWVVITGGFLGVVLMRFAAAIFIRLLDRFPRFEISAYLLVIVIGMKLLLDWGFNSDWASWGWHANHEWAQHYAEWLKANWIFPAAGNDNHHLLNFHDLRRPECIAFWLLMVVCFSIGFIPKKREHGEAPTAA